MSAFALPIPPAGLAPRLRRPTERSATTPEDRSQMSEVRAAMKAGQHPGNLPILVPPPLRRRLVDIAKVPAIQRPHLHLVGGADRHHHKTAELGLRQPLPSKPFGKVGADRLGRPPNLVGQGKLLDPRKLEAHPMHLQRQPIRPPKHIKILTPSNPTHRLPPFCPSALLPFCPSDL